MFWRFGGYANITTIDSILDKPDFTLEELLDESDLIQELKSQNPKLIEYLRDDAILERLLQYVVAPKVPDKANEGSAEEESSTAAVTSIAEKRESSGSGGFFGSRSKSKSRPDSDDGETEAEKRDKQRLKYAYIACEILSCDVWSLTEALLANPEALRPFWDYIRTDEPLEPLQADYFMKVNESLLDKKTKEMVAFIKSLDDVVKHMIKHVNCATIMDLLLKLVTLEKDESAQGIVDWIQAQDLIPMLLAYITSEHSPATQTAAGDFIKSIITISANATGQDLTVIGPNELTRQLVSEPCIRGLVTEMLKGGNPLTVGVGLIIEVIRKNNSDYDIETGVGPVPKTSDPIYLGTLLRIFSEHVTDFMQLILSPNHAVVTANGAEVVKRSDLKVAWGQRIEPLGFDRFKTCELMAELLHCSNMALLNEKGSDAEVKQRDAERERLKAEGKLTGAEYGTSVDSSGFHHADLSEPDESKRLEVQNNLDEDGFEQVAISDATEPTIDDLLERPELRSSGADIDSSKSTNDPLLSSSPRAPTHARKSSIGGATSSEPVGLIDKVGSIDLDTNSPSPSTRDPENEDSKTSDQTRDAVDAPAPLFATRDQPTAASAGGTHATADPENDRDASGEENAQAEGNESQRDLPIIEKEDDGSPLVGDLLKMMFVEHLVVPTILDFFFRFPWNNFLHNVVYDVVQQVFNGQMDRGYNRYLAIDLFDTGRITERIVEGQQQSDKSQAERMMRLGYMGHLTLIAEEVVKFNERQPPELLSASVAAKVADEAWVNYVEQILADTRERDNAILGGVRPDAAGGPRQAVLNAVNAASSGFGSNSNALANAGLSGAVGLDTMDLGATNTGAGYSGNSLLSGFGSSSDEEDEDMDEAELAEGFNDAPGASMVIEDDDQDTQMQRDSSSTAIPAPLSIPPSRARRQLAARLAQKQKATTPDEAGSDVDALILEHGDQESGSNEAEGDDDPTSGLEFNDGFQNFAQSSTDSEDEDDEDDDGEEGAQQDEHGVAPLMPRRPGEDIGHGPLRRQLTRESAERIPLDDGDEDGDEDEGESTGEGSSGRVTDESTGDEDDEDDDAARERVARAAKTREQEKLLQQWGLSEKKKSPSSSSSGSSFRTGGSSRRTIAQRAAFATGAASHLGADSIAVHGGSGEDDDDDDDDDDDEDGPVEIGTKFMRKRGSSASSS